MRKLMDEIHDEGIKMLYVMALKHEDAAADEYQKEAVRQLKNFAIHGNPDAVLALDRLRRAPDLHPFLREIVFA